MAIQRMRTIDKLYAEIKMIDPDTAISKNYIWKLAKSGKIKTVRVGRRILISLDSLLEYLETLDDETEAAAGYGEIRPVPENLRPARRVRQA